MIVISASPLFAHALSGDIYDNRNYSAGKKHKVSFSNNVTEHFPYPCQQFGVVASIYAFYSGIEPQSPYKQFGFNPQNADLQ